MLTQFSPSWLFYGIARVYDPRGRERYKAAFAPVRPRRSPLRRLSRRTLATPGDAREYGENAGERLARLQAIESQEITSQQGLVRDGG